MMSRSLNIHSSAYDILIERPDGTKSMHYSAVYLNSEAPIDKVGNFLVSFTFTPDISGVWAIKLTNGESSAYTINKTVHLTVHRSDITVYQQVTLKDLDSALLDNVSINSTLRVDDVAVPTTPTE